MTSHQQIEAFPPLGVCDREMNIRETGDVMENDQYGALINSLHCSLNVEDRLMLSQFKFLYLLHSSPFCSPSSFSPPPSSSPPLSSSLISENDSLHTFLPIDAIPPSSCLIYHMARSLYESWLATGRGADGGDGEERSTRWQRSSLLYNLCQSLGSQFAHVHTVYPPYACG